MTSNANEQAAVATIRALNYARSAKLQLEKDIFGVIQMLAESYRINTGLSLNSVQVTFIESTCMEDPLRRFKLASVAVGVGLE